MHRWKHAGSACAVKVYAERMRKRKEMGLTYFKMDLHTELVAERSGAVNERGVATEKGLGYLCEFIEAIRDVIGWGTPLAADHFGPLNRRYGAKNQQRADMLE
jgi:L-alanine-DL-glutamate epimerase-like enolase superfamily enzyme